MKASKIIFYQLQLLLQIAAHYILSKFGDTSNFLFRFVVFGRCSKFGKELLGAEYENSKQKHTDTSSEKHFILAAELNTIFSHRKSFF